MSSSTAGTLKWNTIERLSSQVLYAVVGIVLANILSQEDFGLVGALLVFQAFATLFVDSGFSSALIQKKNPSPSDFSTTFWFNLAVSIVLYIILFICAPLIADIFQGDRRLIPLSRVMFLSFILNGLGLIQSTMMIKRMDVKMLAIANIVGLSISGATGIVLAVTGFGPWALVWQTVTLAAVKSAWLWITGNWWPTAPLSMDSLKSMWRLALSVFSSSSLNTFFLYVYSFVIGAFYSLKSLGIYTQADKWSKMGYSSVSQIITISFLPVLSKYQNESDAFKDCMSKVNRFTAIILFPALIGLTILGEPIFHLLFADKWDAAIPLFQTLAVRGIFIVLISLSTNYLLALGYGKRLFSVELIKDGIIIVALLSTIWFDSLEWLVIGQLIASAITYSIAVFILMKATGYRYMKFLLDYMPALLLTLLAATIGLVPYLFLPAITDTFPALSEIRMLALVKILMFIVIAPLAYLILLKLFRIPMALPK